MKLIQAIIRTVVFSSCILATACSSVDNITRVQPSTGFSSSLVRDPQAPNSQSGVLPLGGMVVYAISFDGKTIKPVPEAEGLGSEFFLTVDVSQLLKDGLMPEGKGLSSAEERQAIKFLLYVSNHNSTLWMTRIYALNKARHGLIAGLKDLTAAGSGLSAFLSPPAAASLGAANLVLGSASNEIDEYAYSGKTVEVLFKGIKAARAVQYQAIMSKLDSPDDATVKKYDIITALSDIKDYDALVSFREGLEYLATLADATAAQANGTTPGSTSGSSTQIKAATPPSVTH